MSAELPLVHLKDFEPVADDLLKSLPEGLIRRQLIVPIAKRDGRLLAAVPKIDGIVKPEGLQMMAHCPVDLVLAPVDEIIAFIKEHYAGEPKADTTPAAATATIAPKTAEPTAAPTAAEEPPAPIAPAVRAEADDGSDDEDLKRFTVDEPVDDDDATPTAAEPAPAPAPSAAEPAPGDVAEKFAPASSEPSAPELTVISPDSAPPPLLLDGPAAPPPAIVRGPVQVDDIPNCPRPLCKVLSEAAANRAREILLERDGSRLRLRHRIRGVLVTDLQEKLTHDEAAEAFRYVAENGDAQSEGGVRWAELQLEATLQGEPHGCRFTLSETKNFAMLTVRLTPVRERAFDPVAWGMGPHQARTLEAFLSRRQGVILYCGFEGDDLVGTMHACLRPLVTPERHVIAVQGRREERLPGVEQLVSFGDRDVFSRHLQVAFRHGPDVVLANPLERRDHVEACLNEALRGRLVLARLHAADAADAIVQMLSMGVEPYLVGSALLGVVAQRTLRLNCPRCQDRDIINRDQVKDLGIPVAMQPPAFYRGRGCDSCLGTGFDRETSIFEVLEYNEDARLRVQKDARPEAIRSLLRSNGMMTLRQIAVHKAINGQTSLSEVLRATA